MDLPEQVVVKNNPGEKSLKALSTIYLHIQCMLKKIQSYTEKKVIREPSGWSMFIWSSFDKKENKLDYCREKDCIEKLCKKIKERTMEIIDYKKRYNTINPRRK